MENLGIDIKLLIAQIVNFALFFVIFKKFLAKPFLNLIKEEENSEAKKEELKQNLIKQDEELENKLNKFKEEITKKEDEIIEKAKERARAKETKLLNDAELKAGKIKKDASEEIEAEKQDLYRETRKKIADLSMIVVEKELK